MKHILVSDNDPGNRALLRSALEDAGYQVDEATEGGAGLKQFRIHNHDLVITDIVMVGAEGIETIIHLTQIQSDIKIIAMSDGGKLKDAQRYLRMATNLGAKRVFEKPLDWPKLVSAVDELL